MGSEGAARAKGRPERTALAAEAGENLGAVLLGDEPEGPALYERRLIGIFR